MSNRRLLIVYTYAFGTAWAGATPRIMQIARGLSEVGWDVDLLRCKQANEAELKPVIEAYPGKVFTTPFNGPYPAIFNQKGLRSIFRAGLRFTGWSEGTDPTPRLVKRLLRFVKTNADFPRPDVIWGITVGYLAGPVTAQQLGEYFHCPYIIEFEDPVPHPGRPSLLPDQQQMLESCLSQSALVVTTTRGITSKVEADFPSSRGKVKTFYMSYEEAPQASGPRSPKGLRLLHAGALAGGPGRNAKSLVQAIAAAAENRPEMRGKLLLSLLGAGEGGQEALDLAKELGVDWAVEMRPQLPQAECYKEMDRADVLVAIKFDDPQYDLQIPGKIFQYLPRAKPILGLMRETEAASILRQSGLGLVKANSDVDGIASSLVELWDRRNTLNQYFRPNWEFIRSFSVSATGRALDGELTSLLEKQKRHGAGAGESEKPSAKSRRRRVNSI